MNQCIFSSDRIYRYVLRCRCTDSTSTREAARCNSDWAHYSNTPLLPARPDSRTAARLSSPKSCPTKPALYDADRSRRPRKPGTLHNQDFGEVGRTGTKDFATSRRIAWIGLNPSTADEFLLDQTLVTVCRYSRNWGFSEVVMLNLFAFRATDPRELKRASDPIGPDNDKHLLIEVGNVERVIACWGDHGRFLGRDRQVSDLLSVSLRCLLRNSSGAPHHPLYLKSGIRPKPFGLHQTRK
jgi:hypothetical protein